MTASSRSADIKGGPVPQTVIQTQIRETRKSGREFGSEWGEIFAGRNNQERVCKSYLQLLPGEQFVWMCSHSRAEPKPRSS